MGTVAVENGMKYLKKIKLELLNNPAIPHLSKYLKKMK